MIGASFDSTKTQLLELLGRANNGKLQLPDFQRGWVWDDERIRSLLASVSVSFPIGAVMLLETGGAHVRFKPRRLTGTHERIRDVAPETLILDGQQRLTSLYQALMCEVAAETKDSKNKPIRRWYYFDMKRAVANDDDREDAVIGVPEDRIVRSFGGRHGGDVVLDVTTSEREFEADLFPANKIFASSEWRREYNKHWRHDPAKSDLFDQFETEVIERFKQYQLPVIELKKETPKEAVCLVFERVNTGGVALNVFELLTASFAADDFQLREDWNAREKRLKERHPVLRNLQNDDFLQAISLLVTQAKRRRELAAGVQVEKAPGISCKRKDILKLEVTDWLAWADRVENGFVRAARFLYSQKIFKSRDLPYRTQLVPLAAIFVDLGHDGETEGARQKIARWYWCGVLGELYGGAIESRFARDLPEVVAMVRGEAVEPITIQESSFQANRLITLRTRNSSAYKGLYALLMRDGGRDFRTGEPIEAQTVFDDKVDIHHIFPERWCKAARLDPGTYNSVINKTPLAARTNRQIGGRAPSRYLPAVERAAEIDAVRMDQILVSHCISPTELRADRFWEFFAARAEALLKRIEAATGKTVAWEPELFRSGRPPEVYEEAPEEWEGDEPLEEDDPEGREAATDDSADDEPARYALRRRFWTGLNEYVRARFPDIPEIEARTSKAIRIPSDIQHIGFDISFVPGNAYVNIDVCFWREPSFQLWKRIRAAPEEWNSMIGGTWEFDGSADRKRGYMSVWREMQNLRDERSWQEAYAWLAERLSALYERVAPRLREEMDRISPEAER
jgi:hypothetical protein